MLTQKRLKELLHYNPDTGIFLRIATVRGCGKVGGAVGCKHIEGYLDCGIDGHRYLMHRLAFLYMEGYLPEHDTDHKNGIRDDNRWNNLRHVSRGCNMQNNKIRKDNESGFPGVGFDKDRDMWRGYININKSCVYLGLHKTKLEAALTRLTVEIQCDKWKCNHRGELVKAIKREWPEFDSRCLS